tara:strand:+ start:1110 stop:1313 length:204 start_codon:yes stop_codon:yes gene_type:complete
MFLPKPKEGVSEGLPRDVATIRIYTPRITLNLDLGCDLGFYPQTPTTCGVLKHQEYVFKNSLVSGPR